MNCAYTNSNNTNNDKLANIAKFKSLIISYENIESVKSKTYIKPSVQKHEKGLFLLAAGGGGGYKIVEKA